MKRAQGKDLLIQNATLIDGTGKPPRESISVLIRRGKIAEINQAIKAEGMDTLDVHGTYMLPGLIDSHMHMMWGPGVVLHHPEFPTKETWRQTWGKHFPHYLKAYLACGVTTIMDLAAPPYAIDEIRRHLSAGNPGPRYLTVGQHIAPRGGYTRVMVPDRDPNSPDNSSFFNFHEVSNAKELKTKLDLVQSQDIKGIKILIEKGWNPFSKFIRHSPEMLQAIKKESDERNLPIYVHASSEEDMTTALKLGVHALAHTLISRPNEVLSDSFAAEMAKTNTYQIPTLAIMDMSLIFYYPERLNDPLLDIVVPAIELATARSAERSREANRLLLHTMLPRSLKWLSRFMVGGSQVKKMWEKSVMNSKQSIRKLHNAGVPIVMGSDTPYFHVAVYAFHGYSSLREIELLGEAGLSPEEAIKAATITPAKMLGFDDQIGTIEVGKEADLIIVKNNPLNDLSALKTIQWTIKGGVAHTPQEWMSQ